MTGPSRTERRRAARVRAWSERLDRAGEVRFRASWWKVGPIAVYCTLMLLLFVLAVLDGPTSLQDWAIVLSLLGLFGTATFLAWRRLLRSSVLTVRSDTVVIRDFSVPWTDIERVDCVFTKTGPSGFLSVSNDRLSELRQRQPVRAWLNLRMGMVTLPRGMRRCRAPELATWLEAERDRRAPPPEIWE